MKIFTGDELHTLKKGLLIVDEVRDCFLKRIADVQEEKLYEQLNDTKSQDLAIKGSEKERKQNHVLCSSDVESLSNLFRSLKTILDRIKPPRTDH